MIRVAQVRRGLEYRYVFECEGAYQLKIAIEQRVSRLVRLRKALPAAGGAP